MDTIIYKSVIIIIIIIIIIINYARDDTTL